jgi:Spy/CpxP family protein refolding chaperone
MKKAHLAIVGTALLSLTVSVSAHAMPAPNRILPQNEIIDAGWRCGAGWHVGPGGRCIPNRGPWRRTWRGHRRW